MKPPKNYFLTVSQLPQYVFWTLVFWTLINEVSFSFDRFCGLVFLC